MTATWVAAVNEAVDKHDEIADVKCPDTIEGIDKLGDAPLDIVSRYVWVLEEMNYTVAVFATPDAAASFAAVEYPRPSRTGLDRWIVQTTYWRERAGDSARGLRIARYEVQS